MSRGGSPLHPLRHCRRSKLKRVRMDACGGSRRPPVSEALPMRAARPAMDVTAVRSCSNMHHPHNAFPAILQDQLLANPPFQGLHACQQNADTRHT